MQSRNYDSMTKSFMETTILHEKIPLLQLTA